MTIELPSTWRITAVPTHRGSTTELAPFFEALGLESSGNTEQRLSINGTTVVLKLFEDNDERRVARVSVQTLREGGRFGGTQLRLTRENDADRQAKASGRAREVQLGDDAFDTLVYVDCDADDAEVQRVLDRPNVRAAARQLIFANAKEVLIDSRGVRAEFGASEHLFEPERLIKVIGWVLEVNRGGAPLGARTPRQGESSATIAKLLILPLAFAAWVSVGAFRSSNAVLIGSAVLGLLPATWLIRRFSETVRGSSSAHRIARWVPLAIGLDCALAGVALLHTINGALDFKPGRPIEGEVRSTRVAGEEGDWIPVRVLWSDGVQEEVMSSRNFNDKPRVTRVWHPGLLFAWHDGDL